MYAERVKIKIIGEESEGRKEAGGIIDEIGRKAVRGCEKKTRR